MSIQHELHSAIRSLTMIREGGNVVFKGETSECNCLEEIEKFINLIIQKLENEEPFRVFTMGNGGSADIASHFVADLMKLVYEKTGYFIYAECLNDNKSYISAVVNDISRDHVYTRQLENRGIGIFGDAEDIVVAYSTSGGVENEWGVFQSRNLINALKYDMGVTTVTFTGKTGGELREIADIKIHVPNNDTPLTEGIFSVLNHVIINTLIERLNDG